MRRRDVTSHSINLLNYRKCTVLNLTFKTIVTLNFTIEAKYFLNGVLTTTWANYNKNFAVYLSCFASPVWLVYIINWLYVRWYQIAVHTMFRQWVFVIMHLISDYIARRIIFLQIYDVNYFEKKISIFCDLPCIEHHSCYMVRLHTKPLS